MFHNSTELEQSHKSVYRLSLSNKGLSRYSPNSWESTDACTRGGRIHTYCPPCIFSTLACICRYTLGQTGVIWCHTSWCRPVQWRMTWRPSWTHWHPGMCRSRSWKLIYTMIRVWGWGGGGVDTGIFFVMLKILIQFLCWYSKYGGISYVQSTVKSIFTKLSEVTVRMLDTNSIYFTFLSNESLRMAKNGLHIRTQKLQVPLYLCMYGFRQNVRFSFVFPKAEKNSRRTCKSWVVM